MELTPAAALSAEALAATEAIFVERFPPGLRGPFADLLSDELLVLTDDGRPEGFTVARRLGPTGWTFLRYFAAREPGRGNGSRLWHRACARWAADGLSLVLLDVEDPDEPGTDAAEESLRRRRIALYERLGARLLPVGDYCPAQPGGDAHPLRLLVASTTPGTEIETPVRNLVIAVYRYRYGLSPDEEPVRRALLTLAPRPGSPERSPADRLTHKRP